MEWALPTERQLAFIQAKSALEANANDPALSFMRGAGWRNFAAKYPEANNFHKKMLRVHNKIKNSAALLGPVKYQEALDLVWKAQCNCGYWHGVFGGLYLSDIRSAIYQNLVHAESIADNILPPNEQAVTLIDFDCDGNKEMLIECQYHLTIILRQTMAAHYLNGIGKKHLLTSLIRWRADPRRITANCAAATLRLFRQTHCAMNMKLTPSRKLNSRQKNMLSLSMIGDRKRIWLRKSADI